MRGLMIAVVVVVCVAAGVVGYMVYRQMAKGPQTAAVEAPAVKPAASAAPVHAAPLVKPMAVAKETEEPAAVEASATSAEAAETGSFDANALLGKLDKKQQEALLASMFAQMISQGIKGNHYQLPVLNKFRALDTQDKGKNKLTAAQQAQLKTVMQNIKPQMDAALGELWAKQDQARGQLGQLITKGMSDPSAAENDPQVQQQAANLGKQMADLEKTVQPQMAAFDQQALAAMTPYLTAEQVAAIQAMPAEGDQTFFLTGPNGEEMPPLEGGTGTVFKMKIQSTTTFGGDGK